MEANGLYAPLDKFHLFVFLPEEIQLAIWDLWREDQPVIYHHHFLTRGGRRYAALDTKTHQVVEKVVHSSDPTIDDGIPLDPAERKLHFLGEIMTITTLKDLEEHKSLMGQNLKELPYRPQSKPTATCVHLETDIFIFWSTYKWPGYLRYLSDPFDAELPPDIDEDGWPHEIQKLGIYVSSDDPPLCELDRRAFSQLRGLRNVFLIIRWKWPIPTWWPMPVWRLMSGNSEILVKPDEAIKLIEACKLPRELEQYRSEELDYLRRENIKAETLRTELQQIFRDCKRGYIAVEPMLEALPLPSSS